MSGNLGKKTVDAVLLKVLCLSLLFTNSFIFFFSASFRVSGTSINFEPEQTAYARSTGGRAVGAAALGFLVWVGQEIFSGGAQAVAQDALEGEYVGSVYRVDYWYQGRQMSVRTVLDSSGQWYFYNTNTGRWEFAPPPPQGSSVYKIANIYRNAMGQLRWTEP